MAHRWSTNCRLFIIQSVIAILLIYMYNISQLNRLHAKSSARRAGGKLLEQLQLEDQDNSVVTQQQQHRQRVNVVVADAEIQQQEREQEAGRQKATQRIVDDAVNNKRDQQQQQEQERENDEEEHKQEKHRDQEQQQMELGDEDEQQQPQQQRDEEMEQVEHKVNQQKEAVDADIVVDPDKLLKLLRESNSLLCPTSRRPPTGDQTDTSSSPWQRQTHNGKIIHVFSAIYDDRKLTASDEEASPTAVRLIALSSNHLQADLYCHVWYRAVDEPCVVKAKATEVDSVGGRVMVQGATYRQYVVTCRLPAVSKPELRPLLAPQHVSLSTGAMCDVSTTALVQVHRPTRQQTQGDEFVVCATLPAVTSSLHPTGRKYKLVPWFSEWMELQLMFGVSRVFLYVTAPNTAHLNKHTRALIDLYTRRQQLVVHTIPHPAVTSSAPEVDHVTRNLRTLIINDCLLRNINKLIVDVDADELIVPRAAKATNYSDVLVRARETQKTRLAGGQAVGLFKFLTAEFNVTSPANDTIAETQSITVTGLFRTRTQKPVSTRDIRSIIDTRYCVAMLKDGVCGLIVSSAAVVDVPLHVGTCHRYRQCISADTCTGNTVVDKTALRYQQQLKLRVIESLRDSGVVDKAQLYKIALYV